MSNKNTTASTPTPSTPSTPTINARRRPPLLSSSKKKSHQYKPLLTLPSLENSESPKFTSSSGSFIVDGVTKIGPSGTTTTSTTTNTSDSISPLDTPPPTMNVTERSNHETIAARLADDVMHANDANTIIVRNKEGQIGAFDGSPIPETPIQTDNFTNNGNNVERQNQNTVHHREPSNNDISSQSLTSLFGQVQISSQPLTTTTPTTPISPITPTNHSLSSSSTTARRKKLTPSSKSRGIDFADLQISERTIGAGACAKVKKCTHKVSKKKYALKEIPFDPKCDEKMHKIIVAEFKALYESHKKSHRNIIRMYDAYHRQQKLYMLLEYMDCGSLSDLVNYCGCVPENILSRIAEQVLTGLHHLHDCRSIVHRDIKPENLLVNSKGEVKLADFGMAGHGDGEMKRKVFKTYAGTCLFMSPERIMGEAHGFDSDIWSLGLSLAQLAIGKNPMEQGQYWDLVLRHKEENTGAESSLGIDYQALNISVSFQDFLKQCLRMNPSHRPSAFQLLEHEFIRARFSYTSTGEASKQKSATSVVRKYLCEVYIPKRRKEEEKGNNRNSSNSRK